MGRIGILGHFADRRAESGIAVLLGIGAINTFNPANTLSATQKSELVARYGNTDEAKAKVAAAESAKAEDPPLFGFIPKNPLKEVVRALDGGLLPFMFFSLIFGLALGSIEAEKAQPVKAFLEGLFAVSLRMIDFAMKLAPIGVFCLIFFAASQLGIDLLKALSLYVIMVVAVLAFHRCLRNRNQDDRSPQPRGVLPADSSGHDDRLCHVVQQRDPFHSSARGRRGSGATPRDQLVRVDSRGDRQPERDGFV